jgi:preprotein translocase subunit SecA
MLNNFKAMTLSSLCRLELSQEDVEELKKEHQEKDAGMNPAINREPRNRPCPCGSGLKFKHCCGKLK